MSKKDELSPEQLEWLVRQRSDIQKLCLKVYGLLKTHEEVFNRDRRLGDAAMLCVGAAFSLWRGVFLAPDQFEWKKNFDEGLSYLYDVISTNTVSFGTDQRLNKWSSGYYLNNAMFRVLEVGKVAPRFDAVIEPYRQVLTNIHEHDHEPKVDWKACHECLDKIVAALEKSLELPPSA